MDQRRFDRFVAGQEKRLKRTLTDDEYHACFAEYFPQDFGAKKTIQRMKKRIAILSRLQAANASRPPELNETVSVGRGSE